MMWMLGGLWWFIATYILYVVPVVLVIAAAGWRYGLDGALALTALLCFAFSLGVVPWFVPEPDLAIVCIVAIAMAGYDFWLSIVRRAGNGQRNSSK